MKRAASKPPKKPTRAVKDGERIKGLMADQKKSHVDAVRSADLVMRMQEQQNLLELQNEQLREAHAELEQSHHRYADLYNLAPVGYITLDGKGCIREINQTAAELLGPSCTHLLGRPLVPYLTKPDRKIFLQHLWQCTHAKEAQTITLHLATQHQGERLAEFTTRHTQGNESKHGWSRTAIIDVTERRGIEAALTASEAKFRLLAENVGELFWFMELDPPRVSYVSPAFEKIWGVTAEELYADYEIWMKAVHSDDQEAVHTAFHRWINGESDTFREEYRIFNRDGQIRWIADRGIVIGRKEGRPSQISGIARDVTERKMADMALAEKANETNTILEGTYDGILIADVETRRFTYGNTAMCRMLNVTSAELLTMGMESIHPLESLADIRLKFDAMARGDMVFAENVPLLSKDGRIIPVDITASPVVIKNRACILGVFHDTSERKRAEERFRALLESAPDAMMIHSSDGRIQIVNAQVEILFGYTRNELIGQTMEMLMPERFRCRHEQHRKAYTPTSKPRPMGVAGMELLALHRDGREIPVEISLSNLGTDDHTLVISSIRDITDRKLAEKALQASEERLRLFVENSPAPVAMFDRDMRYLVVSKRWSDAFYLTETPLIGHSHDEAPPYISGNWREIHQRCLAGATETCERDQFLSADGRLDWVKWECRPWYDLNSEIGGIILFAEVINDRVRIEEEIAQARQFAESTLEAVPASLAVLDGKGRIISTNKAWPAFPEAKGGTINTGGVGSNYLAVCDAAAKAGDDSAACFAAGLREVMSGAAPRFSMEYACHSPDQRHWFVAYVTPFEGTDPHSVVIAHVDVSERKRAEQVIRRLNDELEIRVEERTVALQQANEQLRQEAVMRRELEEEILHISEREQQRIGQDLHDDLGQQLAGIWLLSDVLKSRLVKQASPEAENAIKITSLLKNALGLTRSLARGLHPVSEQAGGLIAALEELAARTSGMFHINCRCKCPPAIEMDNTEATHLYRIAQEAVTNGVKHGQSKKIEIELSTNTLFTVLSVKDQGKGIAELNPKHLGMGMRIMRYRADMIGGILDIQSDQSGTTVVCTIPVSPPQPATTPTHV